LALSVLAGLSRFQFSRCFPGLHLWAEADLSTSKSVSGFLLFLRYELFTFNFFFDSSFLDQVFLLLLLLCECFFSLFLLNLKLQLFSICHFLRILLLSFLIAYLLVEIRNFGFLSWVRRALLLLLLLLLWASTLILISHLEFLDLSLALIHSWRFHLHTLFRRWGRLNWRTLINRCILFQLLQIPTKWVVV